MPEKNNNLEARHKREQEREQDLNARREERRQKIIELMKLGFNQAEIADELGICRQRVNQYITRKEFRELQLKKREQQATDQNK